MVWYIGYCNISTSYIMYSKHTNHFLIILVFLQSVLSILCAFSGLPIHSVAAISSLTNALVVISYLRCHFGNVNDTLLVWNWWTSRALATARNERNIICHFAYFSWTILYLDGILPKGPYLPCVSMAGRALFAGYLRPMAQQGPDQWE